MSTCDLVSDWHELIICMHWLTRYQTIFAIDLLMYWCLYNGSSRCTDRIKSQSFIDQLDTTSHSCQNSIMDFWSPRPPSQSSCWLYTSCPSSWASLSLPNTSSCPIRTAEWPRFQSEFYLCFEWGHSSGISMCSWRLPWTAMVLIIYTEEECDDGRWHCVLVYALAFLMALLSLVILCLVAIIW